MDRKPFIINIEEIRRGDKKAFERVYHEFFDVLFYLSRQYLEKEQLAEEVVQDTFMKLWEVRESLPDETNIKNFLYTITKNNCLNLLRNEKIVLKHQQNTRYLEMKMNYEALDSLGDQVIEYDELQNKIQSAISNLPEDIRKVFIMNRFEDLKYKEIAEQLNISTKTVEARISKALKILRKELKDYLYIIYFISHLLF
jgi:RNA polymerase sigma-70 factor (ECF subfamily)